MWCVVRQKVISVYVDYPVVTYRLGIHYGYYRRYHARTYCGARSHYGHWYDSHFGVGLHFRF